MEALVGKLLAQLDKDAKDIKPNQIPLAVAILTDKAALLSGRPTSMSATLTLKGEFNAEEVKARLTGKAARKVKGEVVESKPIELGVGTQSSLTLEQSVSSPSKDRQKLPSSLATDDPPAPYGNEANVDIQSTPRDSQTIDEQRHKLGMVAPMLATPQHSTPPAPPSQVGAGGVENTERGGNLD